jgi:hypothetical protein
VKLLVFSVQLAGVFNPCTPTPFSLRRQRKGGKRKAGLLRSPLPARSGQGFPALLDKGPTRRTRCARFAPSAQTSCASQKGCVPAARGPLVCAARRRRRRATANSQQPDLGSLTQQAGALTTADNELIAGCWVFGCPTPSAPPRSTARRPACRRHAIPSDSASLFEQSERSERREFWPGPACEHRREPRAAGEERAQCGAAARFPLFFGGAKKRGSGSRGEAPWAGVWGSQTPMGCIA